MRCPENTFPNKAHWPTIARVLAPLIMVVLSGVTAADAYSSPTSVEVFTTTEQAVAGASAIDFKQQVPDINLQVYRLDGIRQMELTLSGNLPNDAEAAKRIVLQRIQKMDKPSTALMQQAAIGLAKVIQYGIDRYPVIVFNGEAVVYGVTDPGEALRRYRRWRDGDGL